MKLLLCFWGTSLSDATAGTVIWTCGDLKIQFKISVFSLTCGLSIEMTGIKWCIFQKIFADLKLNLHVPLSCFDYLCTLWELLENTRFSIFFSRLCIFFWKKKYSSAFFFSLLFLHLRWVEQRCTEIHCVGGHPQVSLWPLRQSCSWLTLMHVLYFLSETTKKLGGPLYV